jgi:hypothetical protein
MRTIFWVVLLIGAALVSGSNVAAADDTDAERIIAACAKALGAEHLADLPSLHVRATGHMFGLTATAESYVDVAHGGVNASYVRLGKFTNDSGFDGRSAWTRDPAGVVWVDGSQQGHAAAGNDAYRQSYALWTTSHGAAAVAPEPPQTDGARSFDVVRVTPPGSVVAFDVWIDRATHLPARYVETAAAVTTTTTLSDYRAVNGVEYPYSVKQTTDQGNEIDSNVTHIDVAPRDLAEKLRLPQSDVHDFGLSGGDETSIPFDLIDNHVYLNVFLNGKGPFRFIFDTGGSNVVDVAVAKEIGAVAAGSVQGSGVGATTEQFSFAPIASLRVGNAELRNQLFSVLPVRAGFSVSGSAPVDGLIGAEVLARFVTVFDYAHARVILKRAGSAVAGDAIPFVFAGTQPQIPCELDRIATQCTIDSGSRSSLDVFAPFSAANAAVVPAKVTAPGVNGFGVGGADIGRLGRLATLRIGAFTLDDLIAGFSTATAGAFAVPGIGANIGGGVLKRFTVTYDYPHQVMTLVPNADLDISDVNERSGMFVVHSGAFVVAGVRPGTPAADAGIVKGDTIVSIDGVPADRLTLGTMREAFRRPAATTIEVGVQSKGATSSRTITLTLRDYV